MSECTDPTDTPDAPAPAGRMWIGPSGWSYPDWEGVVYPRRLPRREHLSFIARFFSAVEVNTTFYRPVERRLTAAWAAKLADRAGTFRFAFKLTRTFTHGPRKCGIRNSEFGMKMGKRGSHSDSAFRIPHSAFPPDSGFRIPNSAFPTAAFREGLAPIIDAGLFGCLLIQFPWSFRADAASRDHVRRLCDDFSDLPIAVEVRHRSWDDARWREELAARGVPAGRRGVAACRIDQPALRDCLGVTPATPCRLAYIRLHGRRADTWFATHVPVFERYNYYYSASELEPWVQRIRESAESADDVYVFTNNHYRGQGPANALQLRAMLEGRAVDVPEPLVEAFADLASIRRPPPKPPGMLFDP